MTVTHGPWYATKKMSGVGYWIEANGYEPNDGDLIVANVEGERKDDARLLAAAPDLLFALQAMYKRYGMHSCTEIKLAGDAIAKATGEDK